MKLQLLYCSLVVSKLWHSLSTPNSFQLVRQAPEIHKDRGILFSKTRDGHLWQRSKTGREVLFQKQVRGGFHKFFKREKKFWTNEAAGRVVLLFSSVWKPDETRSTSFCDYFSNKENKWVFSIQIFYSRCGMRPCHLLARLWHNTVVYQLWANRFTSQGSWESTDLDLLKLVKKRKRVWPALSRSLPKTKTNGKLGFLKNDEESDLPK